MGFNEVSKAFKRKPTLENYLALRRAHPDETIEVSVFGGIDPLFAVEDELKVTAISKPGARVNKLVPHSGQNWRVTPFGRSGRLKSLTAPLVISKPEEGIAIIIRLPPPEMYWHSRQKHSARMIGSPSAR